MVGALRKCFARFGYDGATLSRLEQATGVTRMTLLRHFGSKRGMLLAVVEAEIQRRRVSFDALARGLPREAGLREILHTAAQLQFHLSRQDPYSLPLRLELRRTIREDGELADMVKSLEAEQLDWRRTLIEGLLATGEVHPSWSVESVVDLVSIAFAGLVMQISWDLPCASPPESLPAAMADSLFLALSAERDGQSSHAATR